MKQIITIALLSLVNVSYGQNYEYVQEEKQTTPVREQVIDFPDIEAAYPGGAEALLEYIRTNINNPLEKGQPGGKVYSSFLVEKDGSISEIKIVRGLTKEADTEVKRLLNNMPNWIPGEANGEKIATRCNLPFVFTAPE